MVDTAMESVAIRLADEGVPLRAIARAVSMPSDDVRDTLHAAIDAGRLLDLPRDDWPPGFPRDQRALQLSRMVTEDRAAVTLTLQQVFKLAPAEVAIVMLLLQAQSVPKPRLGLSPKSIDVHICKIRRSFTLWGIKITTLWGYGYQLPEDDRKKIMDMIIPPTVEVAA